MCVVVLLYAYAFAGCEPFHFVPFAVPIYSFSFPVRRLTFAVPRSASLAFSRSPSPVIRLPFAVVYRYLPFCVLRPPSACRFAPPVPRFTFPLLRVCRIAFAVSRFPFPVSRFPLSLRLSLVVVVCRVYRLLVCRLLVSVSRLSFIVCHLSFVVCRLTVVVCWFPFPVFRFAFVVCRCRLSFVV